MDIKSFRIRMTDVRSVWLDPSHALAKMKHGKFAFEDMNTPEEEPPVVFNSLEEAFAFEYDGRTIADRVKEWKELPIIPLDAPDDWFEQWLETQI